MDLEVKWSPEAIEDLEAIAEYIARDSAHYAGSVVSEILSASRKIPEFPLTGRMVPEMGDEKSGNGSSIATALSTASNQNAYLLSQLSTANDCWKALRSDSRQGSFI